MTKTKTVLLTLALPAMFHAAPGAHAQMVVAAPILETILVETRAGQVIQHAQMMGEHARSAATIYSQLQTARRMYEMARNNVSRINDVRSWDDFMRWYNRQLALEQMTVRQLDRTGIRIGGQTYGLRQIMEIPRAMGARHAEIDEFWEGQFTPEQRRQMWLQLGLTPANYAFVSAWRGIQDGALQRMAVRPAVEEEIGRGVTLAMAGHIHAVDAARMTAGSDWTADHELLSVLIEMHGLTVDELLRMNMTLAELMEWIAAREMLDRAPGGAPLTSAVWDEQAFRPLSARGGWRRFD